jgi:hypothetical protein
VSAMPTSDLGNTTIIEKLNIGSSITRARLSNPTTGETELLKSLLMVTQPNLE